MAFVIPIFITHEGCPHQCLFCNQQSITGENRQTGVERETVTEIIRQWLAWSTGKKRVQVAFYGGSYSCLPEERQQELLEAVAPYLATGEVDTVRISTRPDCISDKDCERLYDHGVRTVELGCQSMDDTVLEITRRGHSVKQSVIAAEILRERGMELGVQMMVGLPGETTRSFFLGVRKVINMQPDFVRLYPALVVEKTQMAGMYDCGEYMPLSMNQAVALTCRAYDTFLQAGIKVIRMGLQPSESLEATVAAGPYHPSFGELVMARSWFKRARTVLSDCPSGKTATIVISDRDLSAFIGQKRINMERFEQLGLLKRLNLITETKMERGTLRYAFS